MDSSGNGYRLNAIRPAIPQAALGGGGGLGGHTFRSLGKLSNGWTDWNKIWYTSADSSGNGHRLITIRPSIPQGALGGGGGVYGVTNSSLGKLPRGLTDQKTGKCGQTAGPIGNTFCTYNADESGNGHRMNKILNCVSRCIHLKKCTKLYFCNLINLVNAFVFITI